MGIIRNMTDQHFACEIKLRSETKNPSQIRQIDFGPFRLDLPVPYVYCPFYPISNYTNTNSNTKIYYHTV
jgi:hypothetical protein